MKINITKKEYEALVKMVGIANWIINAYETEDQEDCLKPFNELEQRIYSFAKDYGLDKDIVLDRKLGMYFMTKDYEEENILKFIEEYEEEFFWEELISRLAERDFIKKYGAEKIGKMTLQERFEKISEFEKKYCEEFEKNGLENIEF